MVFTISRLQLGQQLPFVQTRDELANYMSRSSVFDRTIRFDVGRYDFLSDGSRSGFLFSSGVISAVLNCVGENSGLEFCMGAAARKYRGTTGGVPWERYMR